MNNLLKGVIVVLVVSMISCRPSGIISEKEMVAVLTKVYLTDATLTSQNFRDKYVENDTIDYYSKILESYGFTKTEFDSSIKYYSSKPKELDKIYDKVISELSKLETTVNEESRTRTDSLNKDTKDIWNLNQFYNLTLESSQNFIPFNIPVVGLGTYTLSYDVQIFPDDEAITPEIKAFFYYDDKSAEGYVKDYRTYPYTKDGVQRHVELKFELNDKLITHFQGQILDYYNPTTKFRNHAIVSNIRLLYKPLKEESKKPE